MLEQCIKKYNEYDMYFLDINLFYKDEEMFFKVLSCEELKRVDSIKNERYKKIYIIQHGLVRYILSRYLSCKPVDIKIYRDAFKKPYIYGDKIYFNISHSKDLLAVVVSKNRKVGIDIQYKKYKSNIELLADKIFSKEELHKFKLIEDDTKKRDFFFNMWTKKEAFSKCLGYGFTMDLKHVTLLDEKVYYKENEYEIVSGLFSRDCFYTIVKEIEKLK